MIRCLYQCFQHVSVIISLFHSRFHRLAHPDGEVAVARACAAAGTIYVYNYDFSNVGIAPVAEASGDGVRFASIYILKDRDFVQYALDMIAQHGFSAVIVTCDHPHNSVRDYTLPIFAAIGEPEFLDESVFQ